MNQLTDIGLHTAIICLGIYFIIYIARYVATKVWIATANKYVRGSIKWVGTMWLPIWPLAIGWFMLHFVSGIPVPDMILDLVGDHPHSPVLGIYGMFCGMISTGVVKAVNSALEKKGIDVTLDDPKEAALAAKQARVDETAAKIEEKKNGNGLKAENEKLKAELAKLKAEPDDEDEADEDEADKSGKHEKADEKADEKDE